MYINFIWMKKFSKMFETGGNAGLTGFKQAPVWKNEQNFPSDESTVTWQVLHRNEMGPKFDTRMKGVQERHPYSESSLSLIVDDELKTSNVQGWC